MPATQIIRVVSLYCGEFGDGPRETSLFLGQITFAWTDLGPRLVKRYPPPLILNMFRYAFNTIGLVMYRSFNSGAYREILKVYAWEVNFHPENCLIYGLGNAISCVFCRIFKENHEYDENAVVGCLFQPSLVSSTKLTPLIKKVTSKWWDV